MLSLPRGCFVSQLMGLLTECGQDNTPHTHITHIYIHRHTHTHPRTTIIHPYEGGEGVVITSIFPRDDFI